MLDGAAAGQNKKKAENVDVERQLPNQSFFADDQLIMGGLLQLSLRQLPLS